MRRSASLISSLFSRHAHENHCCGFLWFGTLLKVVSACLQMDKVLVIFLLLCGLSNHGLAQKAKSVSYRGFRVLRMEPKYTIVHNEKFVYDFLQPSKFFRFVYHFLEMVQF